MNHPELLKRIAMTGTEREWLLAVAGIRGRFHLYEQDVPGLALVDATPEQVLEYVRNNP